MSTELLKTEYLKFAQSLPQNIYVEDLNGIAKYQVKQESEIGFGDIHSYEILQGCHTRFDVDHDDANRIVMASQQRNIVGNNKSFGNFCTVTSYLTSHGNGLQAKPVDINTHFCFTPYFPEKKSMPFQLVATHHVSRAAVTNHVSIRIPQGHSFPQVPPYKAQTLRWYFVYQPDNEIWVPSEYDYTLPERPFRQISASYHTSDELRQMGLGCVPGAIEFDGPQMTLQVPVGDQTVTYTVPDKVPGSITQNILSGKPMIPYTVMSQTNH